VLMSLDYYKIACVAVALLYFFLFYTLQFKPEKLISDIGLKGNDVVYLFVKRTSILMLGFSVLLVMGSSVEAVNGRFAIAASVSVCMLGLAFMSALELFKGNLSNGILPALIIESVVGMTFMLLAISIRFS